MNYTKYADTIDAIKEMYLEIGRLQRENAALRTQCDTLTNRVGLEIGRLQRENAALRTQCETLTNRVDVLSTYVNDSVRDELDLLFIEEDE
jgi:FtsZ-binding cell division protein ZapB